MTDFILLGSLALLTIVPAVFFCCRFALSMQFTVKKRTFVWCFVAGVVAILPALGWTHLVHPHKPLEMSYLGHAFWRACVQAAIPEEVVKFLVLGGLCVSRCGLPSRAVGMTMGATVALGFATFENILYMLDEGFATGILRVFTSVPGHAGMGAIMGYFLARAFLLGARRDVVYALVLPILIHTLYNFPLMVPTTPSPRGESFSLSILMLTLLVLWVRLLLRRERMLDRHLAQTARSLLPPLPSRVSQPL